MAMYTFNLLSLDPTMNSGTDILKIEQCSLKELKLRIAQLLSLPDNSFGRLNISRNKIFAISYTKYRCLLSRCSIDWR
jgi:hypothetical protein